MPTTLRLVLLSVVLAGVLAAPAAAHGGPRCNGQQSLCDRRFDRVVLPAAHNAMSSQHAGFQIPNQVLTIPEQLRLGIRGFLIDSYYGHRQADGTVVADPGPTPGGNLYLCHVLCELGATPLVDALRALRDHVRRNPHDVLLIDNEDYVAPRDFARAVRRSGLGHYVFRGAPGPRWPTLRQMAWRRQQVVVLAEHDAGDVPWYHEAYTGILQETLYTFGAPAQLTDPAQWPTSCRPNRGGQTGSLFLMNHWSPPLAPSPATSAVVNAAGTIFGRARACRALRGKLPTLIAADMVQAGALVQAARWLNATG
jgi:hypothetical protein